MPGQQPKKPKDFGPFGRSLIVTILGRLAELLRGGHVHGHAPRQRGQLHPDRLARRRARQGLPTDNLHLPRRGDLRRRQHNLCRPLQVRLLIKANDVINQVEMIQ